MTSRRVLVTGAAGYLGHKVTHALHHDSSVAAVVATDLRVSRNPVAGAIYEYADVADTRRISSLISDYRIDTIVHLAWDGGQWNGDAYRTDVQGSQAVIDAAIARSVERLIVASSDDVYGFTTRSGALSENTAISQDDTYLDTHHKALVETALESARNKHEGIKQVVLRLAPVLGPGALNGVIALLSQPTLFVDQTETSQLTFVSDVDAVGSIVAAATGDKAGVFNVAGDGTVPLPEAASSLGAEVKAVKRRSLDRVLRRENNTIFDENLLTLLWDRPQLSNTALKKDLGYTPQHNSAEAFAAWRTNR